MTKWNQKIILDVMQIEQKPLSVIDIEAAANIPKPSIYAEIRDMIKAGIIEQIHEAGINKYVLADKAGAEDQINNIIAINKPPVITEAAAIIPTPPKPAPKQIIIEDIPTPPDYKPTVFIPDIPFIDMSKIFQTKTYLDKKADIEKMIDSNIPVFIEGAAGTGKNTLIYQIANERQKPLIRINCSGDLRTSLLIGRTEIKNNTSYFVDGLITASVRNGFWLVLDEINSLDSEILFAIHGLLEGNSLSILQNSEIIKPHKDFRIFATYNPSRYVGTKLLNEAFIDRPNVVKLEYDSEIDKKYISLMPNIYQNSMSNFIERIRNQYDAGAVNTNIGHRTEANIIKNLNIGFTLEKSIAYSYTNKIQDSNEAAAVNTILRDILREIADVIKAGAEGNKDKDNSNKAIS